MLDRLHRGIKMRGDSNAGTGIDQAAPPTRVYPPDADLYFAPKLR